MGPRRAAEAQLLVEDHQLAEVTRRVVRNPLVGRLRMAEVPQRVELTPQRVELTLLSVEARKPAELTL